MSLVGEETRSRTTPVPILLRQSSTILAQIEREREREEREREERESDIIRQRQAETDRCRNKDRRRSKDISERGVFGSSYGSGRILSMVVALFNINGTEMGKYFCYTSMN